MMVAAKALGASSSRIIRKHLLTNTIGTLIVTTTLQIPLQFYRKLFKLSGLGVSAPMPLDPWPRRPSAGFHPIR